MRLATLRRPILICSVAALLAVALGACGSSSSASGTPVAAATGGSGSGARYQARLNLAKCFRAHGLNVPDPSPGGGTFRTLQNYPRPKVQAALQACQQYVRKAFAFANLSPAQIAQFRQQFVKFAECMRSHGVNIPDPTTNGLGGFGFRQALRSVDRNSPAFQSALHACQSLRPRFGRGGPGGGGPGAGGPISVPSA